ncbi:MAG: hypothetical protein WDM70_04835 [Nitrosomonadales bacterium]
MLLVNGMALVMITAEATSLADITQRMVSISALLQPVLLSVLLLLFVINPILARLAYWQGVTAVVSLSGLVTLLIYHFGGELYLPLLGGSPLSCVACHLAGVRHCHPAVGLFPVACAGFVARPAGIALASIAGKNSSAFPFQQY